MTHFKAKKSLMTHYRPKSPRPLILGKKVLDDSFQGQTLLQHSSYWNSSSVGNLNKSDSPRFYMVIIFEIMNWQKTQLLAFTLVFDKF